MIRLCKVCHKQFESETKKSHCPTCAYSRQTRWQKKVQEKLKEYQNEISIDTPTESL